jgi:hypothetical protein
VLKKLIFLARSRSTMVKSMGELKKVVVSKVANNAAENRGNKRKYCFFFLINLYRENRSCCRIDLAFLDLDPYYDCIYGSRNKEIY